MLRALAAGARTLVVIDGYYYRVPAVSHQELGYALAHGVRVLGAASMGALRAAELAPLGMEGVGSIYQGFRRGTWVGDDEVAILHAGPERGYRPLTVALVEVRLALERLVGDGLASAAAAARVIAALALLPFSERDAAVVQELARLHLGDTGAAELAHCLRHGGAKTEDAREALERALGPPGLPEAGTRAPETGYLAQFLERHLEAPIPGAPSLQEVAAAAFALHPEAGCLVAATRHRLLAHTVAEAMGISPPEPRVERLATELAAFHHRRWGRQVLPAAEVLKEARILLGAATSEAALGGTSATAAAFARGLGWEGPQAERLEGLGERQPDLVPWWALCRAFTFTPAFPLAARLASSARRLRGELLERSGGRRPTEEERSLLAGRLWGAMPRSRAGAERALHGNMSLESRLGRVLDLLLVAERLTPPERRYAGWRRLLCRASIDHAGATEALRLAGDPRRIIHGLPDLAAGAAHAHPARSRPDQAHCADP